MGKLKKIGIGFGIIVGLFFALVIIAGIAIEMEKANMTPEERQWIDDERDAKELQVKIDAEQEEKIRAMEEEQERLQKEIKLFRENRQLQEELDETGLDPNPIMKEYREKQEQFDKTIQERPELEKAVINDPLYDVAFDPIVIRQAEKSIPVIQNSFRVILDECNSIRSYSDYIVFATGMAIVSDEINQLTSDMDQTLTVLELLGYDNHHTVGPLIAETRQLGGAVGNCIIDVQNMYGN